MNYPIQMKLDERPQPKKTSVEAEAVALAIAEVIYHARSQGKTLEDLKNEILSDDHLLRSEERYLLSTIIAEAWEQIA